MTQKFYLLVIKNGLSDQENAQAVQGVLQVKAWLEQQLGLDVQLESKTTDLPLKNALLLTRTRDGQQETLYTLDGVKQQLRDIKAVQPYAYHSVLFIYKNTFQESMAGLAYWKDLDGNRFCEIPFISEYETLRMGTHEILHTMHQWLLDKGITTQDTLDRYDHEWDMVKSTAEGNRRRNVDAIKPYIAFFDTPKYRLTAGQLIAALTLLVSKLTLLIKQSKPSRLSDWSKAIAKYEGFDIPGSVAQRNNNPGNLRWSPTQAGTKDGFAFFNTPQEGWDALLFQLRIAVEGKSNFYTPEMTLLEFFQKYAPSSDNNDPTRYAAFVAKELGVELATKIMELA